MKNLLLFMLITISVTSTSCKQETEAKVCLECGETLTETGTNGKGYCQDCWKHKMEEGRADRGKSQGQAPGQTSAESKRHYEIWGRDYNAAQKRAKEEGKSMLLLFTGSDWCPPCMKLHDTVLVTEHFKTELADEVVLVVLDNPRNKSLVSGPEQTQYEYLSREFKVKGVPTLFLTDPEGKSYHEQSGYGGTPAEAWIADLKAKIK